MEKIKFRIWDKKMDDFVTGNKGSIYSLSTSGRIWDLGRNDKKLFPVENLEISQYIGLHDDFGHDIYEGDILLSSNENGTFLQLIGFGESEKDFDNMLMGFKIINGCTLENDDYEFDECKPLTRKLVKKHNIPII